MREHFQQIFVYQLEQHIGDVNLIYKAFIGDDCDSQFNLNPDEDSYPNKTKTEFLFMGMINIDIKVLGISFVFSEHPLE